MPAKTAKDPQPPAKPKTAVLEQKPAVPAVAPEGSDDYEAMRQAAVEPFKRTGNAPKPTTAGRQFDDEKELESYDPLFDEVSEEHDE